MNRRLEVAKAYVEGLEATRSRYQGLQADHMRLNHEAITLAAHVITLSKLLREILREIPEETLVVLLGDSFEVVAHEVLDNTASLLEEVYSCPCGHSIFEHDADGCSYLHCRKVCV